MVSGSSYNFARINIFEKFQILCMFSTIVRQTGTFTTSKMVYGKPEVVITSSPFDIFRNFKSHACFRLLSLQWECLRPPKSVSGKPEVGLIPFRIKIFEKFQVIYMFSTIVSQMEAFSTSKNGFQKTGSSCNFVSDQHFRKISNPLRVFDCC